MADSSPEAGQVAAADEHTGSVASAHRWFMLALGVFAQTASAIFVQGAPFLLPALTASGMPLPTAGVLVALPTVGMCCTLIAWGYLVDRWGERIALVAGPLIMCAAGGAAAAWTTNYAVLGVLLFLGGMGAASTNGASGGVIVGWFPPAQRGLAMGIRQTGQPIGVGIGALSIPLVADSFGVTAALAVPALLAGLAAVGCLLGIIDPPRPPRADTAGTNPYRAGATLWRIHGASILLVIPQGTIWTFGLLWLHTDIGWSLAAAGALITVTQVLGALGRIGAGAWSDRAGSRMRPLRLIAVAAVAAMALLALTAWTQWWWVAVPLLVLASVVTVSDNGLAFTAIAEIAGPHWSGRGLGIQNTGQGLIMAAVPPVLGVLITTTGFGAAYLVAAALAALAIPLVPLRSESLSK